MTKRMPRAGWLLVLLAASPLSYAQGPEWLLFDTTNSGLPDNQVQAIAADGSEVWIGTARGLARYNGSSWVMYDTANSPSASSSITVISTNGGNGAWIGTNNGLAWFDGAVWQAFDTSNSPLPNNTITAIARDSSGVLWIGTEDGLVKLDSTSWTVYNDSNSGLIEDLVRSIAVDTRGTVWLGTFDPFKFLGRLWRFDGTTWTNTRLDVMGLPSSFPDALLLDTDTSAWLGTSGTTGGALVRITGGTWNVMNHTNSGLTRGGISSIAREGPMVWIATGDGLVSFDGNAWEILTRENSSLPENTLLAVTVDSRGNKWVGSLAGGVAVYRKGGVLTSAEGSQPEVAHGFELLQNYPNPFNPTTVVSSQLPVASDVKLAVYDLLGKEVAVLVNERRAAGRYHDTFDGTGLASGLYIYRLEAGSKIASKQMLLIK